MIGAMDQRITLEERVEMDDGAGGRVTRWQPVACDPCVWAAVKSKAVGESMMEGRINATFVVMFTIWNRDDLSELNRIIWNDEAYNIRGLHRLGGRPLHLTIDA